MKKQNSALLTFIILSCASLFLIPELDRNLFQFFEKVAPPLAILADLRLTSLAVVLSLYFEIRRRFPREPTALEMPRSLKHYSLAVIWIVMTLFFVLVKKVWVPTLKDWVDYVAFMVTGLLAEEFLFRGALYDLATFNFGTKRFGRFSIPVWISAVLFGLQHLGYHHFQINGPSMTQVSYTIVMGLVFCNLRESTGRLWPVILLHLLTNSFTVIRNLGF